MGQKVYRGLRNISKKGGRKFTGDLEIFQKKGAESLQGTLNFFKKEGRNFTGKISLDFPV